MEAFVLTFLDLIGICIKCMAFKSICNSNRIVGFNEVGKLIRVAMVANVSI